jgi:predicted  nucleic acid-binding Zn-ribbon protein
MCLDCGCMKPNDDHGDSRHILMKDVEEAAKASEISVDEVVKNINETVTMGQASSGAQATSN